ncbi:hypothetical protein FSARC_4294 [Fusarium sarcochroum]|uniref:Cofilin n=1 Tax=Fusarium sarcochroum TaxID=1208366 RepID=A0A8H4U2K1_9HYPO|nr:hypothetical protein FSARC_4294 [Fusarium sarcochroum]
MLTFVHRVSIDQECITAANTLRLSRGSNKIKFVIFKITDDEQTVVVDETSSDPEYETFRQKLISAIDKNGNPTPRYALYDLRMLYATTMENLKRAVNIGLFIHADGPEDIEWEEVLKTASGGKAK